MANLDYEKKNTDFVHGLSNLYHVKINHGQTSHQDVNKLPLTV